MLGEVEPDHIFECTVTVKCLNNMNLFFLTLNSSREQSNAVSIA